MNKFTLKVNYPYTQKIDASGQAKQIRKKRRLPIIAIGLKINESNGEKEYIAVFEPPKDALQAHVERIQKTIFFDINVIYSGVPTSINKDFEFPDDNKFRKLDIVIAGCSHFILFKENINAIRSPSCGIKYEICGNKKCNESDKVIFKPNGSDMYICENCYEAGKETLNKVSKKKIIAKNSSSDKTNKHKKKSKKITKHTIVNKNKEKIAA